MKLETKLKKAMEIEDKNIRLAKLESICFQAIPWSEIWNIARSEAHRLREDGARYW